MDDNNSWVDPFKKLIARYGKGAYVVNFPECRADLFRFMAHSLELIFCNIEHNVLNMIGERLNRIMFLGMIYGPAGSFNTLFDLIGYKSMPKGFELYNRPQSIGEEIANSVSHGIGLMGAIVAVPILVIAAAMQGDAAGIVGASVFGATMVLLYLTSTLYHALPTS